MIKIKTKREFALAGLIALIIALGLISLVNGILKGWDITKKSTYNYLYGNYAIASVEFKADRVNKPYEYNERIDKDIILAEMNILAERFNLNPVKWEKLIRCESNFNNLAKNKTSTALGLGQYLIGTWQETESFKQFKIARTDYKASLWEMGLDLSTGQAWRWDECNDVIGIYNYIN